MIVKITPARNPAILADFLRKHGFNVGALKSRHFEVMLNHSPGAIDTRPYLDRLAAEPKVSADFDFTVEDYSS